MPTPRRRANSRASSADTPRGGPPAGSGWASTELPKLIAARRRPVGASSATRSGVIASVILGFASYSGTQSERPVRGRAARSWLVCRGARLIGPAPPHNAPTWRPLGLWHALGTREGLQHDPEKWEPVFGKDHAPTISWSGMTIRRKVIPL